MFRAGCCARRVSDLVARDLVVVIVAQKVKHSCEFDSRKFNRWIRIKFLPGIRNLEKPILDGGDRILRNGAMATGVRDFGFSALCGIWTFRCVPERLRELPRASSETPSFSQFQMSRLKVGSADSSADARISERTPCVDREICCNGRICSRE
ncbi:pleiotropic drug resistance protein 1-like [Dorcoceras hygrometricum]|uniref:Pleiotropic drug resistance protein 1-like n=1 Tax=Dorcoceras hygrometricum TaxID=472368 RepID=A0A2Z7BIU4_9LAMI|nr:pleiotropic drug resistance protein 1-like [Dorcoceras hygrometricum]